jgi:hypothetical protein
MSPRALPALAALLAWAVLAPAAYAASGTPAPNDGSAQSGDCVWGQKGYRDCVDRLIASRRGSVDPAQALRDTESRTRGAAPSARSDAGQTRGRRRPGAGSLTPTPPAELRLTPPVYDPAQEAIAAERRQRALDNNLTRMQRDAVQPPIMPPVINPPNGRICPAWGC